MPTLMNIYDAINVLMPDNSIKRAQLADKHYWLIPAGSSDAPMPFEIMTFYSIWSARGMMDATDALKRGVLTLEDMGTIDENIEMPLGVPIGQSGDSIGFRSNGEIAGLFSHKRLG